MKLLILNQAEVEQLLPMSDCITVMTDALMALANGRVHLPLRMVVRPPEAAGVLALMPAYVSGERAGYGGGAYGVKIIGVFPGNPAIGKDSHQGAVLLLSGETGEPLALMNASAITAIRTAAMSGVATRVLARAESGDLAIIGAGVQARSHLTAMTCVRAIRRVRVASRNIEHSRKFAAEMSAQCAAPIEPVATVEAAVRDADLIVTATSSAEPVLKRGWISHGAHLNVVGASLPTAREVDTATIAASSLFVDRRESTVNESGDYLFALREGAIGPDHIRAEIGEVLIGAQAGRINPDEITLFKSLGLAVEDLAAAEYVYRQAQRTGAGTWVEF
ncbi:MAG TPA: ornithine cyclodeaminase family protein [Anaerolineae bacterium]|nr:ornithine cyclodeaminase family protein [Anaerolineae bacterium]